jgi:hypothetical protein
MRPLRLLEFLVYVYYRKYCLSPSPCKCLERWKHSSIIKLEEKDITKTALRTVNSLYDKLGEQRSSYENTTPAPRKKIKQPHSLKHLYIFRGAN